MLATGVTRTVKRENRHAEQHRDSQKHQKGKEGIINILHRQDKLEHALANKCYTKIIMHKLEIAPGEHCSGRRRSVAIIC